MPTNNFIKIKKQSQLNGLPYVASERFSQNILDHQLSLFLAKTELQSYFWSRILHQHCCRFTLLGEQSSIMLGPWGPATSCQTASVAVIILYLQFSCNQKATSLVYFQRKRKNENYIKTIVNKSWLICPWSLTVYSTGLIVVILNKTQYIRYYGKMLC